MYPPRPRDDRRPARRIEQAGRGRHRTVKSPVPLERDVQRAAVAVLQALGCVVHRRNTGAMSAKYRDRTRFVRFSEPGASDLYAVSPEGLHWEIEIKRPGERPTEAQVKWLLAHNGIGRSAAFWADSSEVLERVTRALLAGGRIVYINDRGDYDVRTDEKC